MKTGEARDSSRPTPPIRGWAGWLMGKLHATGRAQPQLRLVERIALAPRQSLALVEAEGRRFLVAMASDGAPAFYPLETPDPRSGSLHVSGAIRASRPSAARVSW